jgi:FkbM family methyltransferase
MLTRLGSGLALEAMALYLRRIPWERGRWRLLNATLPLARSMLHEPRYRTVRTRYGFRLRVNLGDWLGRHVFVTGDYEPPTARLIAALLRPGDFFVDVGANIGYFTLLAARCVGPAGRVIAFEPSPRTREELAGNIALNAASNVLIGAEALSDCEGEATFYEGPEDHCGISSLRSIRDATRLVRVRTARLDDLLTPGRRVGLVKIDVEGAEARVVEGMIGRLESDRPDLIIEVTDGYLRELGDSAQGLCRRLLALGYRMYRIGDDGLIPMELAEASCCGQYNALFTSRGQHPLGLENRRDEHPVPHE